jgi:hypothetical protein
MAHAKHQTELPYEEAQGAHDESVATIMNAVALAGADLHVRELMVWIFNVRSHGDGLFRQSMAKIAAAPRGLCCSEKTARRVVAWLKERGWIADEEQSDGKVRALRIDWQGLRGWLAAEHERRLPARAARKPSRSKAATPDKMTGVDPGQNDRGTPVNLGVPPGHFGSGTPVNLGVPYKEYSPSYSPSYSPPPPQAADEWAAAAEALKSTGMNAVSTAIWSAKAAGRTPAEVVAAVELFTANLDRIPAGKKGNDRVGVLFFYLGNGCWPNGLELLTVEERERRRVAAEAEKAARREREAVELDDEAALDAAVEERLGSTLNAMSTDEHIELLGGLKCPFLAQYRRGDWYRKGNEVRLFMLHKLDARTETLACPTR